VNLRQIKRVRVAPTAYASSTTSLIEPGATVMISAVMAAFITNNDRSAWFFGPLLLLLRHQLERRGKAFGERDRLGVAGCGQRGRDECVKSN
jgi:hypothetical protein